MDDPAQPPLLASRDFVHFWTGQSLAQIFGQLGQVALPVVAIQFLHASEQQVGNLSAAGLAAFLLVGLPAGAWIDRWLKRRTMIISDVVRCVAALTVPLLWFAHRLEIGHLYVVAAIMGLAQVFFDVAYQSYIPILVGDRHVREANAKLETTAQVARLGGPAAGGLLLKVLSAPLLMVADAVGYLGSVIFLLLTRDDEVATHPGQRASLRHDIVEGLSFVWHNVTLRAISASTMISNVCSTLIMTLFPLLVLRRLGFSPFIMGVLLSIEAIGGVAGAAVTSRFAKRIGDAKIIPASMALVSVAQAGIPLAATLSGRPAQLIVLAASGFVMSAGVLIYNITQVSFRQRVCPRALLGRMNASIRFVVWGVLPLSALFAGWLAARGGVVATMWLGAALSVLSVVPLLAARFHRMDALPRSS